MSLTKRLISRTPRGLQQAIRRIRCRWHIRLGRFLPGEPDEDVVLSFVQPGDYVLDIGANIGNYTWLFSKLVGNTGRVLAFEPVMESFDVLASNSVLMRRNISLFNCAASDRDGTVYMARPKSRSGMDNFYRAHVSDQGELVTCVRLDSVPIPRPVALIKIDVEGHEANVISGMRSLMARDRPLLIIEGDMDNVASQLAVHDYHALRLDGSPNTILVPLGDCLNSRAAGRRQCGGSAACCRAARLPILRKHLPPTLSETAAMPHQAASVAAPDYWPN